MKKLSIEEKAKAYDEAIKKAKSWYVDAQIDFKKSLEALFPELKESEDERITLNNMDEQELIKFLKENLKINIWCDYDGCYSPQVNVSITLCDEAIHSSRDYLLKVD